VGDAPDLRRDAVNFVRHVHHAWRLWLLGLAVAFFALPLVAAGSAGETQRVSVGNAGSEANNSSVNPSVSVNGRYVAFWSGASNLVSGDTNGTNDVFIRDRQTGTTERMSLDSSGSEGNGDSINPVVSANGRYVAFTSTASNLVPGDTNGTYDVFVRDRQTEATERVSVDSAGNQSNDIEFSAPDLAISGDGRYVAFRSYKTDLVPGDTNGSPCCNADIFVRDRQTETTERVSVDSSGNEANGDNAYSSISTDGRYVAFSSSASNLVAGDANAAYDVFVRDRQAGTTERVSVDSSGNEASGSGSFNSTISGNGRHVAFASYSTNLVTGDTNGKSDVFVHDRQAGATERVSVDSAGNEIDKTSLLPAISGNGSRIAFESRTEELDDEFNLVTTDIDILVRAREAGTTEPASVDSSGNEADGLSNAPAVSANGGFVAFQSSGSNLVAGDTNGVPDVFVHELAVSASETAESDWVGFKGTPSQNILRSDGLSLAPEEIWESEATTYGYSCVSAVGDRLFTLANSQDPQTGDATPYQLIAVNAADGSVAWQSDDLATQFQVALCPTADTERVYTADGNRLAAFSASDGSPVWSIDLGSAVGAPTVVEGVVYASTVGGTLSAFDAESGVELWSVSAPQSVRAPLVIGGVVVARTNAPFNGSVAAFAAATGASLWTASPELVRDMAAHGSVLYTAELGEVAARDLTTGAELWRHTTPDPEGGIAVVADADRVYVNTQLTVDSSAADGVTEALDPTTGATLYSVNHSDSAAGPYAPFGKFGNALINHYHAFDAETGSGLGPHSIFADIPDEALSPPEAVSGHTVYGWERITADQHILVARDATPDGGGGGGSDDLGFAPAVEFPAGTNTRSVAAGTLDGGQALDLAVANDFVNTASVLLGDGSGTFGPPSSFGVGDRPFSVAAADLNGDGAGDLVTSNIDSSNVSVLLGNGDGTFASAVGYGTGTRPFSVAVADLDQDSALDIVTANRDSNNLSVLLGNGDGTFGPASGLPGSHPMDVEIADLDGDSNPDLVTVNGTGQVAVYLGNGDGSFNGPSAFSTGFGSLNLGIGDLDGDGNSDLVITNENAANLSVLPGNGDGTFGAQTEYQTGGSPREVAIGDLNGDSNPDLAVANSGSGNVSVLLGNGDGTFDAEQQFDVEGAQSIAMADLNGDSKPDLATTGGNDNVSVLLNTTGQVSDPDADDDGIADDIDTAPGAASDGFDDGAGTSGSITDRAGLSVTVEDAASPDGVRVIAGQGSGHATLDVCGEEVQVDADSEAILTCGSVIVETVEGEARVVLADGLTVVTIPAGSAAEVTDNGDGTYTVENRGEGPVTVTVDGVETTVEPGETTVVKAQDFEGFFAPVDNPDAINVVKAGRGVPFKWRLLDADGDPVTDLANATLTATSRDCTLGTTLDQIEELAAGASGLQNLGDGYYQLNWRTPTKYAGSCKATHLDLGEGVTHDAYFNFRK
jgi:outer membrane protein assembly factor BamB